MWGHLKGSILTDYLLEGAKKVFVCDWMHLLVSLGDKMSVKDKLKVQNW